MSKCIYYMHFHASLLFNDYPVKFQFSCISMNFLHQTVRKVTLAKEIDLWEQLFGTILVCDNDSHHNFE